MRASLATPVIRVYIASRVLDASWADVLGTFDFSAGCFSGQLYRIQLVAYMKVFTTRAISLFISERRGESSPR
jgi:hypothetical protein